MRSSFPDCLCFFYLKDFPETRFNDHFYCRTRVVDVVDDVENFVDHVVVVDAAVVVVVDAVVVVNVVVVNVAHVVDVVVVDIDGVDAVNVAEVVDVDVGVYFNFA